MALRVGPNPQGPMNTMAAPSSPDPASLGGKNNAVEPVSQALADPAVAEAVSQERRQDERFGPETWLYHGTSIDWWANGDLGRDLYATNDPAEAASYAFETASRSWQAYTDEHGLDDESEIPEPEKHARRAVVVAFQIKDVDHLDILDDDASGSTDFKDWRESLGTIGSLRIRGQIGPLKSGFTLKDAADPPPYGPDFYPSPEHWTSGICTVFACALNERFGLPMYALVEEAASDGDQTVVHAFCMLDGRAVDGRGILDRIPCEADYVDPGGSIYYQEESSSFKVVPVTKERLQDLHYVENMDDTAAALWFIEQSCRFDSIPPKAKA